MGAPFMGFRQFIRSLPVTGSEADFIRDARRDDELPDARSWRELRKYLVESRLPEVGLGMARRIWLRYEFERQRLKRPSAARRGRDDVV